MDDRLILIAVLAALIVLMSMWQLLGVRVQKLCNQNERILEHLTPRQTPESGCTRLKDETRWL